MNISYNWLRQYIDTDIPATEVAQILTSIGLEVEAVRETESIRGGLKGLVVGKVLTCEAHPNSDHLHVTTIDVGSSEPLGIVCGAPNVAAGQKVIVATVGTVLYDGDKEFVIKPSKLRGVPSNGMICAEDEIGVGTDHAGIIVLPDSVAVGTLAKDYYGVQNDTLIEVDITPNRSDAASHYGVARDLAAALVARGKKATLNLPSISDFKVDSYLTDYKLDVRNVSACPRYSCVVVSGVEIKPSPEWLQNALRSIGMTPINNVVDVSNYILLGIGQPLHTFDADKISGRSVIVDNCPEGTPFITLDGVERKLSSEDLMICDADGPMCIAGVFGGKESGISQSTKNVLIECAWFNSVSIRKTARRHGLSTDASFRYERGTDPNIVPYALKRAAMLIKEVAGGEISQEIIDSYPSPVSPYRVQLSRKRCFSLIGKQIPEDTLKTILSRLEMVIVADDGDQLTLDVPRYRVDVTREADVVEDILRIYGYDQVETPEESHNTVVYSPKPDRTRMLNIVAEMLQYRGYNEIMNNTLTRAAYSELLPQTCPSERNVLLANPLSSDLNALRQSLVFGALESLRLNSNYRNPNLRLFEIGNVQSLRPEADKGVDTSYVEKMCLSLLRSGNKTEANWATKAEATTFFDLKSDVEAILMRLGLNKQALIEETFSDTDMFAEGINIKTDKTKVLVSYGVLSKALCKAFDIDTPVYYAEIDVDNLVGKSDKQNKVKFSELPKYPEVKRDLALLVDESVNFAQIKALASKTEKKLLKNVSLFDVYQGKNLPSGKKSYAVSFILRDDEKTLTDKQIEKTMQSLTNVLNKELGAELR